MTLESILGATVILLFIALYATNAHRARWKKASIERSNARAAEFANLLNAADFQKRRADEFFGIIQGIETERDTWRRFYEKSTHHAGVAQAWLLRDLAEAVQAANDRGARLRALGEKVRDLRVDPRLDEVVKEFGLKQEAAKEIQTAPGFEAAKAAEEKFSAEASAGDAAS